MPDSEMVELLLSMVLTCSDGKWILDGIARSEISDRVRTELIVEVLEVMPDDCKSSDYVGQAGRKPL